jgi:hypothetical protein
LKKRGQPGRVERRQAQVEVNLLAESEGGKVITKTRRGCSIPFLGSAGLLLLVVEAVRTGLG